MFIHDTALKFHISDQDWCKTTQKTWSIIKNQANFIYSQEQTAMFSLKKKRKAMYINFYVHSRLSLHKEFLRYHQRQVSRPCAQLEVHSQEYVVFVMTVMKIND